MMNALRATRGSLSFDTRHVNMTETSEEFGSPMDEYSLNHDPSLEHRESDLVEEMDRQDCDPVLLFNTYRQFQTLNRLISRWPLIFDALIAPIARRVNRRGRALNVLDIGCGGGDVCLMMAQRAAMQALEVTVTGIDPDERAIICARQLSPHDQVQFRQLHSEDLVQRGESFDVVISNHLLHHLQEPELQNLCQNAEHLAEVLILFNDIRRSRLGYRLFRSLAPLLFDTSYIVPDGLTSIRRSFTPGELSALLPAEWQVRPLAPGRLMVVRELNKM